MTLNNGVSIKQMIPNTQNLTRVIALKKEWKDEVRKLTDFVRLNVSDFDKMIKNIKDKANKLHDKLCAGAKDHFDDMVKELQGLSDKIDKDIEALEDKIGEIEDKLSDPNLSPEEKAELGKELDKLKDSLDTLKAKKEAIDDTLDELKKAKGEKDPSVKEL